jgi:hypothetical protein
VQDEAAGWVRERDDEQPVELWDERTGEMIKLPKKGPRARARADALAAGMLRPAATAGADDAPDAKTA